MKIGFLTQLLQLITPITQFKIIGNVFGNWIFVWAAITHLWAEGPPTCPSIPSRRCATTEPQRTVTRMAERLWATGHRCTSIGVHLCRHLAEAMTTTRRKAIRRPDQGDYLLLRFFLWTGLSVRDANVCWVRYHQMFRLSMNIGIWR